MKHANSILVLAAVEHDVTADGLHPTERGYEIWAEAVMPTFREMLGAR